MKIGIITIHSAYNYGSALQAVATCEAINNFTNHQSEIINYQPDSIMSMYSLKLSENLASVKALLKYMLAYRSRTRKKKVFDKFWKESNCLSEKRYISNEQLCLANSEYDCFVVGSDQVWNPDIVKHAFPSFCLAFADKEKTKMSYASSFGVDSIDCVKLEYLNRKLQGFTSISVREEQAKALLNNMNQQKTTIVCDPVFLISKEDWIKKVKAFELPREYILVYCVEQNKSFRNKIRDIGLKLDLPIVDIGTSTNPLNYVGMHSDSVGPGEFLYALQNASYVITNSFHGTAFSIIFEKHFIVKAHSTRGIRMKSLLEKVDMRNKLVSGDETVDELISSLHEQAHKENSKRLLIDYIQESRNFLVSSLMEITRD